jgi:dihydrofolate reductase
VAHGRGQRDPAVPAAGLLDEIEISLAPVLLGEGERLFADLDGSEVELEQVRAVEAPGVTHITYRVNTAAASAQVVYEHTAPPQ